MPSKEIDVKVIVGSRKDEDMKDLLEWLEQSMFEALRIPEEYLDRGATLLAHTSEPKDVEED